MKDSFRKIAPYIGIISVAILIVGNSLVKPAYLESYHITVLSIITVLFVLLIGYLIIRRKG